MTDRTKVLTTTRTGTPAPETEEQRVRTKAALSVEAVILEGLYRISDPIMLERLTRAADIVRGIEPVRER